jgi:glycosyltransferase involved in cell wall biosynthesis
MKAPAPPLTFAIDSQISAEVAGGTETALLSLIHALGKTETEESFVLLGMKQYGRGLVPFMGPNQRLETWPWSYSWYQPNPKTPLGARSRKLQALLGPAGGVVPPLYRLYRHYKGARSGGPPPMTTARADRELRAHQVSVVHFPYPHHFPTRLPFVYEPWGLPHHHQPDLFGPGEREWMDRLFRGGCEEAALVVTATRWVKQDIVKRYGIDPGKVAVIPRLPRALEPAPRAELGPHLAGLPADFALFPAMTWPSKNHLGMLRALARLRDGHQVKLEVVCTGRLERAHWPRIQAELGSLGLGGQVHFLGPVPAARLSTLYRSARFLLFPSLFEGLGLPLVEAFQHGLPVVASRAACIPEVVGDAAVLFDPLKEESMVEALLQVIRSPGLAEELKGRGAARLSSFFPSSEKMARMFVACYRRAASAPLSGEQQAMLSDMMSG